LLDAVEREPVQDEVSAVRILFELLGFLLSSDRVEAVQFLPPFAQLSAAFHGCDGASHAPGFRPADMAAHLSLQ
jgi:hypothetical protein